MVHLNGIWVFDSQCRRNFTLAPYVFAGESSESVRQGLRAVVSGRNQSGIRTPQSPMAGSMGGNSPASASQMNQSAGQSPQQSFAGQQQQQQQQMSNTSAALMNNAADAMDSMRFNFDIPQTGKSRGGRALCCALYSVKKISICLTFKVGARVWVCVSSSAMCGNCM